MELRWRKVVISKMSKTDKSVADNHIECISSKNVQFVREKIANLYEIHV